MKAEGGKTEKDRGDDAALPTSTFPLSTSDLSVPTSALPLPTSDFSLSVLIAAHNEHDCIFSTLDSVFAQHEIALQVIVASDGSTDGMNDALIMHYALQADNARDTLGKPWRWRGGPHGRLLLLTLPKLGKGGVLNAALARSRASRPRHTRRRHAPRARRAGGAGGGIPRAGGRGGGRFRVRAQRGARALAGALPVLGIRQEFHVAHRTGPFAGVPASVGARSARSARRFCANSAGSAARASWRIMR